MGATPGRALSAPRVQLLTHPGDARQGPSVQPPGQRHVKGRRGPAPVSAAITDRSLPTGALRPRQTSPADGPSRSSRTISSTRNRSRDPGRIGLIADARATVEVVRAQLTMQMPGSPTAPRHRAFGSKQVPWSVSVLVHSRPSAGGPPSLAEGVVPRLAHASSRRPNMRAIPKCRPWCFIVRPKAPPTTEAGKGAPVPSNEP